MEDLVCPECKGPLIATETYLLCASSRLLFPVENGIPVLVIDRAQRLDEERVRELLEQR